MAWPRCRANPRLSAGAGGAHERMPTRSTYTGSSARAAGRTGQSSGYRTTRRASAAGAQRAPSRSRGRSMCTARSVRTVTRSSRSAPQRQQWRPLFMTAVALPWRKRPPFCIRSPNSCCNAALRDDGRERAVVRTATVCHRHSADSSTISCGHYGDQNRGGASRMMVRVVNG